MRRSPKPKVASVVSALAAVSCNGTHSTGQHETPAPLVSVQPAPGSALSAAPASSTGPDERSGGDPRMVKLRGHAEWRAFKALWRQLDAIEPASADAGAPTGWPRTEVYAHAIDATRANELSKQLADAAAALRQAELLTADETAFLRQLTSSRIRNMLEGSMRLMVMHVMPPPYAGATFGSVDRLEQRIDVLVALRQKGQLRGAEYARAMADVQRQAVTTYVLYELEREGYGLRGPTIEVSDGETMLAEIHRRIAAAKADGGAEASPYAPVAARAKALLPAVRSLIIELER